MIPKSLLERWENLYREIKHPYTEKNRSFLLFQISLWSFFVFFSITLFRLINEVAERQFSIPSKAIIENVYYSGQLFFFLIGLLEFSLSVFFRKKGENTVKRRRNGYRCDAFSGFPYDNRVSSLRSAYTDRTTCRCRQQTWAWGSL